MHSSSLALVGVFGFTVLSASGCRIEARSQTQFENSSEPAKLSVKDWIGEPSVIENAGVNPAGGITGVEVKVSSTATKISAEATFAAHADDDKKSEAKLSIQDAIATLVIEESANGFTIKCGHGGAHGTSSVAGSGCKILRVTIPAGSAQMPHNLTVGNGAGAIRVGLADAGDAAPFVKNLLVDDNGLGAVDIRVHPVKDSTLVVTGEGAVRVALPRTFSAGNVLFTVDESDPAAVAARILISSDFPGMVSGSSFPTAGATAEAAALLNVQSKGPFSSDTVSITGF